MKKFKNWTKKPITRGDYLKWCGISIAASLLMCTPALVNMYKVNKEMKSLNDFDELSNELDNI
jgi:hypothetical protein